MTDILNQFAIANLDNPNLQQELQAAIDNKTKPIGSLGQLEQLAVQLGLIAQTTTPQLHDAQVLICAGDHGLAKRGVSAFGQDVTWQMVLNFLAGGAAVSVIAKQHGLPVTVADCGVAHEFESHRLLRNYKIAHGTQDCTQAPAMTAAQCQQAIQNGADLVRDMAGNVLILGEMGIGNTASAALILSRLGAHDIYACTGAGTGLDAAGIQRKAQILEQALSAHPQAQSPLEVLAHFGGFEIATMTGAMLQAAADNRVLLIDGFIVGAALLVAARLNPLVLQRCIFAHQSNERGHGMMLQTLQPQQPAKTPLLQLGLRLGEGSGAVLAYPLLQSACTVMCDMASFAQAKVDTANT